MALASVEPSRNRKIEVWDERFLALARHVAEWSKDPTTKVGSVIVGPSNELRALGYNGFPRNLDDVRGRFDRPDKYTWTEHAERNAIYAAARVGIPLEGCRMYLSWFPCVDCARAVIQAGLVEVIAVEPNWTLEPWGPQLVIARALLEEAGVNVRFLT